MKIYSYYVLMVATVKAVNKYVRICDYSCGKLFREKLNIMVRQTSSEGE